MTCGPFRGNQFRTFSEEEGGTALQERLQRDTGKRPAKAGYAMIKHREGDRAGNVQLLVLDPKILANYV